LCTLFGGKNVALAPEEKNSTKKKREKGGGGDVFHICANARRQQDLERRRAGDGGEATGAAHNSNRRERGIHEGGSTKKGGHATLIKGGKTCRSKKRPGYNHADQLEVHPEETIRVGERRERTKPEKKRGGEVVARLFS